MEIRYFGNDRQFSDLREEWLDRVQKVWSSGHYFQGAEVEALEARLATVSNRSYCVTLGSCTDALRIASNFYNPDEIYVTDFSFIASASGALDCDGKYYLADITSDGFCPNVESYEKIIQRTDKKKALIHVELFGECRSIREIERFCNSQGIVLIEDAAQSFGSIDEKGRAAGSFGQASCISFDPTKIISGTSLAGALLTDSKDLYDYARMVRLHGRNSQGEFVIKGGKSLVANSEAEIILIKLGKLDEWILTRRKIADRYNQAFCDIKSLLVPACRSVDNQYEHTYHKYVLRVLDGKRDELKKFLESKRIHCRIHYPRCISDEPVMRSRTLNVGSLKYHNAKRRCSEVLSLPLYQELRDDEINYIIDSVRQFFRSESF